MLPLLGQFGQNNDPFEKIPPEMRGAFIAGIVIFLLIFLVIFIFFLLTLSKALGRCEPRNRAMEPGLVWLNLIPLVNLVWMFFTVVHVSNSLSREFSRRREHDGGDYGRGLGITTCVLYLLGVIPVIGGIFGLAWLVCFIIYWVKIANYSGQLAVVRDDYEDDRADDEDDRDRRRDDDPDRDERERRPWDRR